MKRISLAACMFFASACWGISLEGLNGGGPDYGISACVESDAGRCCQSFSAACTDGEPGCEPWHRIELTPERCVLCLPWEFDDGGTPELFTPPPQPPPDATIAWVDDAGVVHDNHVEVCGPATYRRY